MESNAENKGKQRRRGGVTGKGFVPGRSGNPKGRPRTRGLLNALKQKLAEVQDDGRTVEAALVEELVHEALKGRNRLAALSTIFDRVEGRPKQQLDFNDITKAMQNRSPQELIFYAEHGYWPEDKPKEGADATAS